MNPRKCLLIISVLILLAGLGTSIIIYRSADDDAYGVLGYEDENGSLYPVMPEDSKVYLRNLELYGGKMGVLTDTLRRWFVRRWHGRNLAFTVAFITLFVSFGFIYAAFQLPSQGHSRAGTDIRGSDNPDGE
ncbi:MAG: hypothetical protein CSYNP_01928 [Syntrophus sp. SKADARSKE-3]|nr:hypothetical protein [Syntrophus sp. SKADARSKE-3]